MDLQLKMEIEVDLSAGSDLNLVMPIHKADPGNKLGLCPVESLAVSRQVPSLLGAIPGTRLYSHTGTDYIFTLSFTCTGASHLGRRCPPTLLPCPYP